MFTSHATPSYVQAWNKAGANLTIVMKNDRFKPALEKLTDGWERKPAVVFCDVGSDAELDSAFAQIKDTSNGRVDALLHSMAYAPMHAMKAPLLESTREDWRVAHDISAYSLLAITRGLLPLMPQYHPVSSTPATTSAPPTAVGGSILSLSYIGAQRAAGNYKVMGAAKASLESLSRYLAEEVGPRGIRVNCISAGPIDTLASRGISGFTDLREAAAARAPLRRGITLGDVGGTATFLASDASAGITGQTLYVDCGFSAVL